MPGNLEALLILPEHASGVKDKPLIPQGFLPVYRLENYRPPSRCQGRRRRRSEPLTPALATSQQRQQWTKAPAPPGPYLAQRLRYLLQFTARSVVGR
jgi:hypothetical protein